MNYRFAAIPLALWLVGIERVEASTPPDGIYRCHKLSSGRLIDIGAMQISGGRATRPGLPEGWTINAVSVRGTNDRGQIIVAVD